MLFDLGCAVPRSIRRHVADGAAVLLLDDKAAVAAFVIGRRSSFCKEAATLATERAGTSARRQPSFTARGRHWLVLCWLEVSVLPARSLLSFR